jgi:hypothetical protein
MTGTIIKSGATGGYYLDNYNPVTVATGVTITNSENPALGSRQPTFWTIVNFGTLLATGANGFSDGVGLSGGGGAITNMAGGSIAGYYVGVSVAGSGTVVNQGTIASQNTIGTGFTYGISFTPTTAAVLLGGGGVYNGENGVIASDLEGVDLGGGGSVVNAGTISASDPRNGFGVVLLAGGSVNNAQDALIYAGEDGVLAWSDAATVDNQGLIFARNNAGVVLNAGGSVTNAFGGAIEGYFDGVDSSDKTPTTVTNSGFLYGFADTGALLAAGGTVANTVSGTISGYYFGVRVENAAGSVVNSGTIVDGAVFNGTNTFDAAGVQLASGGVVNNEAGGSITSQWKGVEIGTQATSVGGTVVNYGTILAADSSGDGAGVWIHGPGAITNAAGGLISGGGFGIVAYYQTTVVNQGTVFGTEFAFDAVNPGHVQRIIDLPGGVFQGIVEGGNTLGSSVISTLELGSGSSVGTIGNIGTFVDFGRIALDAGATWSIGGSVAAGETIAFGGKDASLILASPSAAGAGAIVGFTGGDTIVLSGITDVSGLSFGGGNTLTVAETGDPGLTLGFDAPLDLTYAVENGSTDISQVPCFLPGTHILTDRGEVVVEKLQVGDLIATRNGGTRRLCWIGRGRTLATRGRRNAATPVIVRKGALADNVPHADLYVTKGHSLYFDGVLIPVEYLVNHRSILWDDRAQEVTVFHLELDAHDVLQANCVSAESYRDDGNRWLFQNANSGWGLPPQEPCAPVLTGGPLVDAVWKRLLDRAGPLNLPPMTDDPDLHLIIDGNRVDMQERRGSIYVFRLPSRPKSVVIASREAVPTELGIARDPRSLGVALRKVVVRQGAKFLQFDADDERLTAGFHQYEPADRLRWTDGHAELPAESFARFDKGAEVMLYMGGATQYPDYGDGSIRVVA